MFAIIDLEWTSWKNSHERNWSLSWEHKEIIQIGTIKFKKNSKLLKAKNIIVSPSINKNLSLYIQKLTGINQFSMNTKSKKLIEALLELSIFYRDVKIIYCNGLDKQVLAENCKINKILYPLFLNKIINIRPQISNILSKKQNKIVSANLNEEIGLRPLKKHEAVSDCINILNFIRKFNLI
jgi:inhibitor of KinA sporulation pathway (predicted exonuclease)